MCTGISLFSKQGNPYWGRTQEFDLELEYAGLIMPRGASIQASLMEYEAKHSFVGMSIKGINMIVDGVNDAGLAGGSFYFANVHRYVPQSEIEAVGKLPLAGEEFVTWALANCRNVEEVREKALSQVAISSDGGVLGESMPQHYVFQDLSGKSIVVEPSIPGSFSIYDNSVGTFTNSPKFDWHMTNLENYVGLTKQIFPGRPIGKADVYSSGKGNGLHGIPGDFTPHSRFVRATFLNHFSDPVDSDKAIELVFHVLDSFDIPKGVIVTGDNHSVQYTQYTSAYDLEARALYVHMYDNRQVQMLTLEAIAEPTQFEIEMKQKITKMKKLRSS
ncbi:choloylglycine hydrolase family protein [Listeria fleischmannii]|uniref:Choloylglycine hydrolase n=1 Tax=Listeria fleischmannii FSL S10-1203 TaxID=1265822 RepID=W7DGP4_9LIST|nr:choloylglycine hydrolase family protein [Listeria fleischmannii]EUJ48967.1 choloylglycine hydrolase [Listeria fleischmannii FSL S10-1203]